MAGAIHSYNTHQMRDKLASWLMEVCQAEEARSDVFCLTVSMMDMVLSRISVSPSHLQLLASACLLVSWKVRQHKPISAARIVKYSECQVKLEELLEWEVYILSVLQWNLPTVVPPDLLDPLLRKVLRLRPDLSLERTRLAVESLVVKGLSHHEMSAFSPAVTAAAAVLLTIRPELETPATTSITSSPQASTTSTTTPPFKVLESPIASVGGQNVETGVKSPDVVKLSDMERVTRSLQKLTLVEKSVLMKCLETLETVTSSSSPLSEAASSQSNSPHVKTPTKILEAATSLTLP